MLHPVYRVPLPDKTPRPYGFWGRTSSDRQAKDHTIEGQLEEWFTYCRANDIDPHKDVHYFLDEGVSGGIPIWERPNGAVMREYIRGGYVTETIITMYIDRTARDDVGSVYDIMEECERFNLHFRSVNDGVDTRNEGADTQAGIAAIFARANKRNQLKRMAAGKIRKARQGYWIGSTAPFGHVTTPDNRLAIDPDAAQTILTFYSLITQEGYGVRTCARYANAQRIPTPSGEGEWRHGSVSRVLKSPSLYGEAQYNKERSIRKQDFRRRYRKPAEEVVTVPCPPILTRAQYDAMHRALEVNTRHYANTGVNVRNTMLSNLYCGECGARYYPHSSRYGDARYFAYRHAWATPAQRSCSQPTGYKVSSTGAARGDLEDGADEQIWRQFVAAMDDLPKWRAALEAQSDHRAVDALALARQAHEEAQAALEDLDASFWRKRQLTRQQYDRLLPQLQQDVERAQGRLEATERAAAAQEGRAARIDALAARLETLRGVLDRATLAERREIMAEVVERVTVRDGVFAFQWFV